MDMNSTTDKTLIAVDDLVVTRGSTVVINGASLRLATAERLAIAGHNGAGKSTLLRALIGLERVHAGSLSLFGKTCTHEADFKPARKAIGFLFQDSDDQLFCPTVIEDVAFGPMNQGLSTREARAKALQTLNQLGIADFAERISYRLSGGEKRLVCLAGLLAMEPRVLLLDEPTTGLDEANAARLIAILKTVSAAMIIVSHDMSLLAELATRATILRGGKLFDATLHRHPHAHNHVHIHAVGDETGGDLPS